MPRFAAALAGALGLAPAQEWDGSVALVPPGAKIELAQSGFFAVPQVRAGDGPGALDRASQADREEDRHADAV